MWLMTYRQFTSRLRELGEKLNWKKQLSFYDFRRGRCEDLKNTGIPDRYINAFMGWKDGSRMLSVYTQPNLNMRDFVMVFNNLARENMKHN